MQGRVRYARLAAVVGGAFAWLASTGTAHAQAEPHTDAAFVRARDRYFDEQRGMMVALAAWAGVSLAGGTWLVVAPPGDEYQRRFRRAFGSMALAYGAINMALAAGNLAGGTKPSSIRDGVELTAQRHRATDVFAANVGLDMVYVWVGVALWADGSNATVRGMGSGMFTQGAFLVGFDATGATLYRH